MKNNSKQKNIFASLCIIALVVFSVFVMASSVSAADALEKTQFNNNSFSVDVPAGSNFIELTKNDINIGDLAMNMAIYVNEGENVADATTIMNIKDSSADKSLITDVLTDLKKEGPIVEENNKYFVVEMKTSNNEEFINLDIAGTLDGIVGFAENVFPGEADVNVSVADRNVAVNPTDVSTIASSDYLLCMKNPENDQLVVLSGNDLDLLKSMADTVSFN